jgi:hypothetical protein
MPNPTPATNPGGAQRPPTPPKSATPNPTSHHTRNPGAWLPLIPNRGHRRGNLPTLDHYDQTER